MLAWFTHKVKVIVKLPVRFILYLDQRFLAPVDRTIANYLLDDLNSDKRKEATIALYLKRFSERNPGVNTEILSDKLAEEIDRVRDFTNLAILLANIRKAKLTFWITAPLNMLYAYFASGMNISYGFGSPLLSACLTYGAAIWGTNFLYNERVNGAMISVSNIYEKSLKNPPKKTTEKIEIVIDQVPESSAIKMTLTSSTKQIEKLLNKAALMSFAKALMTFQPSKKVEDEKQEDEHEPLMPLFHESSEDNECYSRMTLP